MIEDQKADYPEELTAFKKKYKGYQGIHGFCYCMDLKRIDVYVDNWNEKECETLKTELERNLPEYKIELVQSRRMNG